MGTSVAIQQQALSNARSGQSFSNYAAIIRGFMAKGLAESEISPRENVFTYNAWKALGRQVRKGERGVRCLTFITTTRNGREEKRPWSTTVFHVSQTDAVGHQTTPRGQIACIPYSVPMVDDHDATPENVPYAGEEEDTDQPKLSPNQHKMLLDIIAPTETLSIEKFHADLEASGARFEHVKTDEVDYLLTPVAPVEKFSPDATVESFISHPDTWKAAPVNTAELDAFSAAQPYVAPKESAYNRAMRGETVSIMDMISDLQREPKQLPRRLQSVSFSDHIQRQIDKSNTNDANRKPFQTKTVEF